MEAMAREREHQEAREREEREASRNKAAIAPPASLMAGTFQAAPPPPQPAAAPPPPKPKNTAHLVSPPK